MKETNRKEFNSMTEFNKATALSAVALLGLLLAGCGGGGSDSGSLPIVEEDAGGTPTEQYQEATIDATSSEDYRYFDLATGQEIALTAEQASSSTDWDIAFRRSEIKLNGGASGSGAVEAAIVAEQEDFYDASGNPDDNVFLNATAESELEHLLADYTAPADLIADSLATQLEGSGSMVAGQLDMGWYWYDFSTHAITLNDSNGWLLRSGEGESYARFRATALTYDRTAGLDVTFDFDVQVANTDQFSTTASFTAHIDAAGGEQCFDFDTNSSVACSGTLWDLKVGMAGRSIYLYSNGGVSGEGDGAAFGPFEWAGDLELYTSATFAPNGDSIAFLYKEDSSSGAFAAESWYAYNLTGTHKLHPNYRVFWVDTDESNADSPKYLLQIINYYSDAGVSGNVAVRWRAVE